MRWILTLLLVMVGVVCFAQEQSVPTLRLLPEDVEQDSIKVQRISTNSYVVRFTYTEEGAKKTLAFGRAHAGQEVVLEVGRFEVSTRNHPSDVKPAGWTEKGWLKRRTSKFLGVSEDDARKIVEGLTQK
jgi:hypothetical protein